MGMDDEEISAILQRHGFLDDPSVERIEAALEELRTIPPGNPDAEMRTRYYEDLLAKSTGWRSWFKNFIGP